MEQLVLAVELKQLVGLEVFVEEQPLELQSLLIESGEQSKLSY
jgi:hypothetical protein